jgi:hypothetical protein
MDMITEYTAATDMVPSVETAPRIVTVLGMHRSGTSLCANMLQMLGVDMADASGASPANERGHWERSRINDLNDLVFAAFGRRWVDASHVLALPDGWLEDARVQQVQAALVGWLAPRLGGGRAFGFKDPRTARLMPMWRQVYERLGAVPRYVFCVRDPAQVARSLSARDRMARGQAEYRWLVYNADAVAGVAGAPVCVVPYEDWFSRPVETARRLAAFVGMGEPDAGQVHSVIDPDLRHDDEAAVPARAMARRLHRQILRAVVAGRFDIDLPAFCTCVAEFEQLVQPLLVETEVLRVSVADQHRVIGDLNGLVRQLRLARGAPAEGRAAGFVAVGEKAAEAAQVYSAAN